MEVTGSKHSAVPGVLSVVTLILGLAAATSEFVLPSLVDSPVSNLRMSLPFWLSWYVGPPLGLLSLVLLKCALHYSKKTPVPVAYRVMHWTGGVLGMAAFCWGAFFFLMLLFAG